VDLKRLDVQLAPPAREGSMGSSLPQNSDGGQGGQSGHGGQAGQGGQQWAGRDGADRGGGWQTGNSHSPGTYDRGTQRNEQSDLQAEVADESINVWM
jgi:hypothetical protein